ncbi:MAG: hypothetical protein GY711_29855 [bacterium]|nr:hypothetical protein [bacterium]
MSLRITDVRFTPTATDAGDGLVGFLSMLVNDGLVVDGVTLRRSAEGELYLSYPARTDRNGTRHPYVRPREESLRVAIERQVLDQLDLARKCR